MITVEEALQLIHMQVRDFGSHEVDLLHATGRVLAHDIRADRDYPPFDRVTMDGIAINSAAFNTGQREFYIQSVQAAGQPQQILKDQQYCLEVMTGAMLPQGCDVVIPYEQCVIEGQKARINISQVTAFQNIHATGTDSRCNDTLINAGTFITPAVTGLLATAGFTRVGVNRLPNVAVCATGDELVKISEMPLPHQIRQSNSYMLSASLQKEGILTRRYHLPDEANEMLAQLNMLTQSYDVVLLSGAVSKGRFDHLPDVLKELGMQTVFHGIAQRPGKPFLFGVMPNDCLIFGFPGNPASTFVCYQLYFREWLYACVRKKQKIAKAYLDRPFNFKPALALHMQVTLAFDKGKIIATPVNYSTSGDLVNLALAEGILSLPANRQDFDTNEAFDLLIL